MNIQVCYSDNRLDYINYNILDSLIESKKIVKFSITAAGLREDSLDTLFYYMQKV